MRRIILLAIFSSVSAAFIVQKHQEQIARTAPAQPSQAARKPSPQDWARQGLDTTRNLQREIAQQEKDGGLP